MLSFPLADAITAPMWLLPLIPILFLAGCFILAAMLSLFSGWYSLAQRFRTPKLIGDCRHRFVSIHMGESPFTVHYRACVTVTLSPEGVGLSVFPLLRLATPPLPIPWAELHDCIRERRFFAHEVTTVRIGKERTRITFAGAAGKAIHLSCQRGYDPQSLTAAAQIAPSSRTGKPLD